jgi:hypothetical protein
MRADAEARPEIVLQPSYPLIMFAAISAAKTCSWRQILQKQGSNEMFWYNK